MHASDTNPARLVREVREIAVQAGAPILEVYHGDFEVRSKSDSSPVTEADEAAERVIVPALHALAPGIPVIAEEAFAAGRTERIDGDRFWLVDPLDGTREFVARRDEFTVNIALIERGRPVLGVVYAPALDALYIGAGPGTARALIGDQPERPISVRSIPEDGAVVVSSRSHGDPDRLRALTEGMKIAGQRTAGSSLKFCLVASGDADIYPRYGPTCEWDTAAGHAVLLAAGGSVRTLDGAELRYGKGDDFLNPEFIARGRD